MPTNAASGSWCTISAITPSTTTGTSGTANQTDATKTACQEYKHETSTDPTTGAIQEIVTIESQNACPFEISLNVKPTTCSSIHSDRLIAEDYVFDFYLDGVSIASGQQPKSQPYLPWNISYINQSDYSTIRTLQFAKVNLVDPDEDGDQICNDEKVIKSLGTIQINVTKAQLVCLPRKPVAPINQADLAQTSNQMKFSERSKKACLATTAGLAQPTANLQPPPTMKWYVQTKDPQPFLQFIFKYKPRAILESEGTIEPTIVHEEVESSDHVSDKENQPKREKTKNENNKRIKIEDDDEPTKKNGQKKDKKPKIVDLTLSDDDD
ncbi:hypothetical protein PGT21_020721 [Puccinia graminis f. sp. tritici]|uniref:DUF7918 domain-containing protein n=2 Tax=Puccinia graminis f. sp. tritici TaxID=56615 RepID=E3K4T4_PUCGT|nr:uncharacterized protein PGTG_05570 [Puccinia graminis f. sp. tritici CRL 75-36-700-3]EFP79249.1 hypothetical protein PGTG_05570 [Puccinia graminis f. sp. tritici CRL 75-36-700-3]KAA1070674.1 hypothetical protein PGT21_020807 [Puccinia graminis f. sp. tritici]KAA1087056.1 hypothetical protein PGT21_020721 [Puccinia graminis f. sp. tritici]KAA1125790.1 hypothetical protein PGTUg99_020266 [Puccinia graminis f. sp. tritici]